MTPKTSKISGMILAAVLFATITPASGAMAPSVPISLFANHNKTLASWLWNTKAIESKPDAYLTYLANNQINTLYLQINRDVPISVYQTFIEQAQALGIQVYALDGSPTWVSSVEMDKPTRFFDWLHTYQTTSEPEQQFAGVHLDVEPYLTEGWKNNRQRTIERYQNVILFAEQEARSMNLTLGLDIPFWLGDISYSNTHGKGMLNQWVYQHGDTFTVMAYRDKFAGANGIQELVTDNLAVAAKYKKPVVIGVETCKSNEGNHLSFFEESMSELQSQIEKTNRELNQESGFDGIAIHSLSCLMAKTR